MSQENVKENDYNCISETTIINETVQISENTDDQISHDFLKDFGITGIKRKGFFAGMKKQNSFNQ